MENNNQIRNQEAAAEKLVRAYEYLDNNFGGNSTPGREAMKIIRWAEYKVRGGYVSVNLGGVR
jgi:hypothetical protein